MVHEVAHGPAALFNKGFRGESLGIRHGAGMRGVKVLFTLSRRFRNAVFSCQIRSSLLRRLTAECAVMLGKRGDRFQKLLELELCFAAGCTRRGSPESLGQASSRADSRILA